MNPGGFWAPQVVSALMIGVLAVAVACAPATPQPTVAPLVLTATIAAPTATRASTAPPTSPTAAPSSTAAAPLVGLSKAPDGKYLFLEVLYVTDGSGRLPQLMIDFPAYRFDAQAGTLAPFSPNDAKRMTLSAADWGFIGRTSWRRGAAGGGGAGSISAIVTLPMTFTVPLPTGVPTSDGMDQTRSAPAQLTAVASDGAVEVIIDGERNVLVAGREWTRTAEFDVSVKTYLGRYKLTATVRNNGWLERAKIRTQP